ncbi:MAG: glycosyltransferase family 4 protein [Gammaproteobacteria bacterium]|nr:glycosyltransferase family 4 protein [Gammaproteobacteria bacterium]
MIVHSPMPRGSGAFVVHESLQAGIPGYRLEPFDPRLALLPPLLRFVPRPPADLIHTCPDCAACFSRANVPLIVTFHGYVLDAAMRNSSGPLRYLYYTTLLRRLTRVALEQARAVTGVSRFTAELVRRDMGWDGPIRVIYNGVDTEGFRPAASRAAHPGRVRVLYCGNLRAGKGVHLIPGILDALDPHVDFIYTAGLRTKGQRIPHPRAINAGSVAYQDMPALYNSADILLFPTLREGFGLVVAEAMACGLPVVASDCSSMPELVKAGEGGFLCTPSDVREFAARINLLAADPALRRRMGAFNRARAESLFRRERMLAEYRALFEEILSSRR